jgi:P27 family predicted phage terminase small subunit
MGRPPLPSKVKSLRATSRKCREVADNSPVVTSLVDVKAPTHLTGEAKKVYTRLVTQLFNMGYLAEIDVDALSLYAYEYSELIKLQRKLQSEGYIVEEETKMGTTLKEHPLHKVVMKKLAAVNALGSQFGWSPVSRVRLHAIAAGKEEKNDFTDFTG